MADAKASSGAQHRNEVLLTGRVAAEPVERVLPSGDRLVTWRLVVDRPAGGSGGARAVDTVDCVARSASARRVGVALRPGDVAEVSGALRRRFWQTGNGPASRYEVEAAAVRRLARAVSRPRAGG